MNYIKEVNAFQDTIIFNPLSSSAIALWFALMHFNNKSGWKNNFTVAATQPQCHASLKPTSFKRAREELRSKGHIFVTAHGSNRAAEYHMNHYFFYLIN